VKNPLASPAEVQRNAVKDAVARSKPEIGHPVALRHWLDATRGKSIVAWMAIGPCVDKRAHIQSALPASGERAAER